MPFHYTNMIKNSQYITLKEVLSRVLRHPLLQNIDLETGIQYAVDFIHIVGTPGMFEDRETIIPIVNHRGTLPCDLISVVQVMDMKTHTCMRSATDSFLPDSIESTRYSLGGIHRGDELTFRIQNTTIITSIESGEVKIAYRAIPVDEEGMPLLLDNPTYLRALEAYIKKEAFTVLYDQDLIKSGPYEMALKNYGWAVAQLQSEMAIPSESEMEAICRSWTTLIQRTTEFDSGFKNNGNREYLRRH